MNLEDKYVQLEKHFDKLPTKKQKNYKVSGKSVFDIQKKLKKYDDKSKYKSLD